MRNYAQEIFLLITTLSQLRNKDRIIKLFIESLNDIFEEYSFEWFPEISIEGNSIVEVCTKNKLYGFISFKANSQTDTTIIDLIHNSSQLLALFLEKTEQEKMLLTQKNNLQTLVDKRTKELHKINLQLEDELSDRTRAEEKILKLNRVYTVLSNVNQAIVRIHDARELLSTVCRMAVEYGKFRMAWIGVMNLQTNKVDVVASDGVSDDDLEKIENDLLDALKGKGYTGIAARKGKYKVANNILSDDRMIPWRGDAVRLGYNSFASFPLKIFGKTIGAFTIYSNEPDSFEQDDIKLLDEMAMDVSFALEYMESETQRKKAEENIHKEFERANLLLELYEKVSQLSDKQLYDHALDYAVRLTDSAIGFFHLVSDDQEDIILTTWNTEALKTCTAVYDTHYPIERAGNWVDCVRLKRPVIYNDYAKSPNQRGFPEGHSPVKRFMSIPVMENDKVRIIFGVGNKTEEYNENDVVHIQLVANELQKIIKQRNAEQALKENEEKYRTLIQKIQAAIIVYGSDTRILTSNSMAQELLGLSEKQLLGKSVTDFAWQFFLEDGTTTPMEKFPVSMVLASRKSLRNFVLGIHRPGKEHDVWCLVNADPVFSDADEIVQVIVTFIDITERKEAEMALLKASEHIRDLYNKAPCGYHSLDKNGVVVMMNDTELKWLGYQHEEVIGKMKYADLFTEKSLKIFEENFPRFKASGVVRDLEFELIRKDGSILPILYSATAIIDSDGNLLMSRSTVGDITERKKAEKALQESEMHYHDIVDLSQDMIVIHQHGKVVFINEAGLRLVGASSPGQIIGRSVLEFVPSDRKKIAHKRMGSTPAEDERKSPVYEQKLHRLDGTEIDIDLQGMRIRYRGDEAIQFVARDITERKRAEAALRESEWRYHEIFDNVLDSLYLLEVTEDGRFRNLEINPAFEKSTGLPRTKLIGKFIEETVPEEVASLVITKYRRCIEAGHPIEEEVELDLPSGRNYYRSTLIPARDETGRIYRIIGISRDITERKQAEQKIIQLAAIVEYSDDAIIGKTLDGIITTWNRGAETIYGYCESEIIGKSISILMPPDKEDDMPVILEKIKRGEHIEHYETVRRRNDGKNIHVSLTISPIVDTDGNMIGASIIGRDITERRLAMEALRQSEERYRLIAENTVDTITVCDLNLKPIYISPSVLKLQGYTVEEAMKQSFDQLFTPKSIEKIKKELAEQIILDIDGKTDPTKTVLLELEMYCKDRSVIWVELAASFLRNKELKPTGILTVARNITRRKQAEEEHYTHLQYVESMNKVNRAIQGGSDADSMMSDVLHEVLSIFDCDRAWLFYACDPDATSFRVPMEITRSEYPGAKILNVDLPLPSDMARNLQEALESDDPVTYTVGTEKPVNKVSAGQFGVMSMMLVALYPRLDKPWAFGLHQCSYPRVWTQGEKKLFKEIGRRITDSLTSFLILRHLKDSEERYRIIAENTADTIVVLDMNLVPIYVSPSVLKLRGYSVQETMTQTLDQMLTPESLQKVNNTFAVQMELETNEKSDHSRTVLLELEEYCKDGSVIWVELAASFLRDNEFKLTGILTVTRNITDRKQAEEKLRILSRAVEQSPASIVITDIQGKTEYVNSKFTNLTGYPLVEALQQNPRILKSGEMPPDHYKEMWEIITSGKEWHGEFLNKKKNGELYWELASISPVFDAAGAITHFLAVKEDISDRKHAEEEISKLNQELEQRVLTRTAQLEAANKELETFSYSVSHDLRSPLRSINGFSQILLEDYRDQVDEQGKDYLQRICSATQHMAQLIDDMLNLSHVSRSEMNIQQVNLSEIVQNIADDLRETQPERQVEFVIQQDIKAWGDGRLLHIVLDNLIGNAWKFTSKHPTARIEFGVQKQNESPVYFIRDDGAGFEMKYVQKLFGAFQRLHTNTDYPGTGIGLATVQRVIQRHGGRVWAEGEVEKGTTIYFTIT
jgi:PAS domain S-box-containing protein